MGYIEGTSRGQMTIVSFEEMVDGESMVRVIDRFVEVCDLGALGFGRFEAAATGRPGYDPRAMTKLQVYGYENGIRSSRKLEKECRRNVEAMWLMEGVTPDYKTIAEFRKHNLRPLQKLFREFVKMSRSWGLIGGELMAIDGSKFKASNNKKMNFSRKKLDARLARLEEQIREYFAQTEKNDAAEEDEPDAQALQQLLARKELYESYKKRLDETGENELSVVDPDARLMGNNRGGVDVAYNVQTAVDAKHHMVVAYDVSMNPSDQNQLSRMTKKVKRTLLLKRFIALADKGYYNGEDLKRVKKQRVTAIVARQKVPDKTGELPEFHDDKFSYNRNADCYTCPMGQALSSPSSKSAERRLYRNKSACANCPLRGFCAGDKTHRTIRRSGHAEIYEETDKRLADNMALYKRRQQIVEHPFGTVKHTLHGGYFLLRTRRKVRTEAALLFLAYNLKRAVKVLGFQGIMDRLNALSLALFTAPNFFSTKTAMPDAHGLEFAAVL